ncbi:MAG: amino acid transporter [Ignavibacteria bacterium GWB2_35_12]|nr:MAG: amino acid transporter [Ignavibacteria bacterium GWA2_35_8]OGU41125.1 MAG: amino acid transporter [Ignavibacteria bacterium GWB2_35_12]OGU96492.1 MAG: amino acid transporter [Ignavibacteria bacterium RIFOXYA2_FULL_35_10]
MINFNSECEVSFTKRFIRNLFGKPRDLNDPGIFHKLALIPFFAWIGLGADGLSSSAYGPEEAFRTIGSHSYLALILALATAFTVFIISYAYSRIIEHFPHGGGGYIVATHMLGERAGVVSGSALVIDYILTITVSIASCSDAIFSYLPFEYQKFKILFAATLIIILTILNIRGVKESISILAPIFLVFVITHIFMLGYGITSHFWEVKPVIANVHTNFTNDIGTIGFLGIFLIFIRAYSLGGGTYTGIEAVSNGLQIMRDPKVRTGKRTMMYMASSLALAAGGLLLCYLLVEVKVTSGKTLNSVLADTLYGNWKIGSVLAFITIFSEGALLFVAAQAGFIDAPRVMANMAVDSWLPRRFAAFSDRLTMRNGIVLIGIASLILLLYTQGSIQALVIMYSINVFLTFSISEFGMSRFYFKRRKNDKKWKQHISIHLTGLVLCLTILSITIFEKFMEGGWLTLLITSILIGICYLIRNHYEKVKSDIKKLEVSMVPIKSNNEIIKSKLNKDDMTAIQLVSGYNGFGIHTFFAILQSFPNLYKNFVFVSIAVIDQGLFKGEDSLAHLKASTEEALKKYVELAQGMGYHAEYRLETATDIVEKAPEIIEIISVEYKNSTVFSGKLAFRTEKFYHRLLHNETAFAIQRKLQVLGITNVILPIKMGK